MGKHFLFYIELSFLSRYSITARDFPALTKKDKIVLKSTMNAWAVKYCEAT